MYVPADTTPEAQAAARDAGNADLKPHRPPTELPVRPPEVEPALRDLPGDVQQAIRDFAGKRATFDPFSSDDGAESIIITTPRGEFQAQAAEYPNLQGAASSRFSIDRLHVDAGNLPQNFPIAKEVAYGVYDDGKDVVPWRITDHVRATSAAIRARDGDSVAPRLQKLAGKVDYPSTELRNSEQYPDLGAIRQAQFETAWGKDPTLMHPSMDPVVGAGLAAYLRDHPPLETLRDALRPSHIVVLADGTGVMLADNERNDHFSDFTLALGPPWMTAEKMFTEEFCAGTVTPEQRWEALLATGATPDIIRAFDASMLARHRTMNVMKEEGGMESSTDRARLVTFALEQR